MTDQSNLGTRLSNLRDEMRRIGLKGFLVPHSDEYQNEYLPPCAERLAWLTGFSGSAGTAVVLLSHAAIFVDGRYTLQVREEVQTEVFVPFNSGEQTADQWVSTALDREDRLGYDPWLHSGKEIEGLKKVCERKGIQLIPCDRNPLDAVWNDKPDSPTSPVKVHPIKYAGHSAENKCQHIAKKLGDDHIDVAVLTAPDSIAWLLNIRGNDVPHTPLALSFALLKNTGEVAWFIDSVKLHQDVRDALPSHIRVQEPEEFKTAITDLGHHHLTVLCDYGKTASWIVDQLRANGANLLLDQDPCAIPKACKNAVEIEGSREAHRRDGAAVCQFLAWLAREGKTRSVTELDAQQTLDKLRQDHPLFQDFSFPTISGAGSNGAIVHYRATSKTNRSLERDSLYLVDSGAQYCDGTTDITRTVAIGVPSEEHRDRYTRVLKGHIALGTARFPKGTTGGQLDVLARQALWDVGLDYDHGTGHGVGSYLGVHEGPQRISKAIQPVPLQPGMIVSNEPGYYKAGAYGIRIENLVVVCPSHGESDEGREFLTFETLTLVPYDLSLIDPSLLSEEEIVWVNEYHLRVREAITPLVNEETQSWIFQATQPLSLEVSVQ
ncbi:MAG: aminopeptidase P family protein [Nitrospirae bacterium]|nr:aminopeptidase P family protein [Nitrospirota bacterium]